MNKLSLSIALLSLLIVFVLMFKLNKVEDQLKSIPQRAYPQASPQDDEEVEVAIYMDRLQRFSNKLYAAGEQGNSALVTFYTHEMEEVMEELIAANVDDDGFDLSSNMETYGLNALNTFTKRYASGGKAQIDDIHAGLVLSCNSCHAASGRPFLVMTTPEGQVTGQDMSPR